MSNPYSGDILKIMTADGSTIQVQDGDALRDRGISNAVKYSVLVRDHFANIFAINDNQVLESNFEELHDEPITVDNLLNIEDSARKSLEWMVNDGSASRIEADCTVDNDGARHTEIRIFPPGEGDPLEFKISKYSGNWEFQALNPSDEKVTVPTW